MDPPVIRTLSCPADVTFYHLHLALQTAFNWATTHSFDFAVQDPDYVPPAHDGPDGLMQFIQETMAITENGGRAASAPREYMLRITDPVASSPFSGIDRMHEGQRKHPRTVEKDSQDFKLWQLLENAEY